MKSQTMDRHLADANTIAIAKTRENRCYELLCGCKNRRHFKYYKNGTEMIAESFEDSKWIDRQLGCETREFTVVMMEEGPNNDRLLTMISPDGFVGLLVFSSGRFLGMIQMKETAGFLVFKVSKADGSKRYKIHPPTCLRGCCIDCCYGNVNCFVCCCCCNKECRKPRYHVFPSDQAVTHNGAPHIGTIVETKEGCGSGMSDTYNITFPNGSTSDEKALLIGSTILLDAVLSNPCRYIKLAKPFADAAQNAFQSGG